MHQVNAGGRSGQISSDVPRRRPRRNYKNKAQNNDDHTVTIPHPSDLICRLLADLRQSINVVGKRWAGVGGRTFRPIKAIYRCVSLTTRSESLHPNVGGQADRPLSGSKEEDICNGHFLSDVRKFNRN